MQNLNMQRNGRRFSAQAGQKTNCTQKNQRVRCCGRVYSAQENGSEPLENQQGRGQGRGQCRENNQGKGQGRGQGMANGQGRGQGRGQCRENSQGRGQGRGQGMISNQD